MTSTTRLLGFNEIYHQDELSWVFWWSIHDLLFFSVSGHFALGMWFSNKFNICKQILQMTPKLVWDSFLEIQNFSDAFDDFRSFHDRLVLQLALSTCLYKLQSVLKFGIQVAASYMLLTPWVGCVDLSKR